MRVQILSVCFLVLVASSHVIGVSIAPRFKRVRDRVESRAEVQNRDATVDTYLGAMDEEAYYTLHNVLQHQKSGVYTNVLVVERSNTVIDDGSYAIEMLFERPIGFVMSSNADLTKGTVYHAFPKASEATAAKFSPLDGNTVVDEATFSAKFVKELHKTLKADATNWKHLEAKLGNAPKSSLEKQFHVYSFGTPSGTGKVAIVIRIAEMGLQPDLVWPMVHPIYAAIKAAGGAHVNVLAVAAGGVTNSADFPGKNHLLHKSLFVGFQVNSVDGLKVAPLVSLSDDSKTAPTNLLAAKFDGDSAKPNQDDQAKDLLTAAKTYYQDTTKDWSSVAGTTSLTVAFFGGEPEKQRGNTLKLHDVNMEDYFYILFANKIRADNAGDKKLPTLTSVAVFRVDCDPYDVSSFVESYNAWTATQKSMPRSVLVDIIEWGLNGQNLNALPAGNALLWKTYFPERMDNALTKAIINTGDKNFVRLGGQVLHPFLLEVATDLLKDSQKLAPGTDVKAKAVQALSSKRRDDITAFVNEWAKFLWAKRKEATGEETASTDLIVPVWVRGKWFLPDYVASGRDKVKVTNSLEFFKATGVAVDRSFYKASNVAGLKQLNELLFASKRTPYDFAVRHVVCEDFKESTTKLCDNIPKLKQILAHDDSFKAIYTQPCATHEQSARAKLTEFCDDDKAKVNKFF